MTAHSSRRTVLFGVVACVAYYVLLDVVTPFLPYASVPTWWRDAWPSSTAGVMSWFAALDLAAALLAAIPVAAFILWRVGTRSLLISLIVGLLVATSVLISSIVEYPVSQRGLTVAIVQFSFIGSAVAVIVLAATRCSLISRWSDR